MAKFNWEDGPVLEIHPDGSLTIDGHPATEAEFAAAWKHITGEDWPGVPARPGVINIGDSWGPYTLQDDGDTLTVSGGGGGAAGWVYGGDGSAVDGASGANDPTIGPDVDVDPPHWPAGSAAVKFLGNTCGSCGRDEMEIVESEFDDGGWEITNKLLCNSCSHERLDVFRFHHYE